MEQFFTSLSKRQTMLLLTSLSINSTEAVPAYEYLPADEEELLRYRASALLEVPKERRIPVLVREIKRLVTQRRRQLASADPRRLAEVLKGERPAMVEVVLRALPMDLAEAVQVALGRPRRTLLVRDVKPEVLSIIRWRLEDALRQGAPQAGGFRFSDLLTLQQRELWVVADRMGARVLATAVAGLPEAERQQLFAQLPPDQRALAQRAADAGASRRLSERDARLVLEMHGAIESPSSGMRSAGIQRIARACLAQSTQFAQRMIDRYQGELGCMLKRWVREERTRAVKGDGGRLDIVEQLERLAQKGIVDRPMRLPPPPAPPSAPPSVERGSSPSQAPQRATAQERALGSKAAPRRVDPPSPPVFKGRGPARGSR